MINKIDVKKHLSLENTIFIDEIERGYHYTEYTKVWQSLIKTNIDYLVTTQSLEVIKALCELDCDFEVIRINKDELGLLTNKFSKKEVKSLINDNLDLR